MSTLTRTAKSWRSWSTDDLLAFNIQVIPEDPQAFFGVHLSAPNVPSVILDHIEYIRDSQEGPSTRTATHFFFRLREVMERPDEVSAVHDFILFLLETLEFNSMKGFVIFGTKIPFTMCGKDVIAKPDIVVIDPSGVKRYRLLIQLAKCKPPQKHPEPQLIAAAIAAFSKNNLSRKNAGLSTLESQEFLGIIMVGTTPDFYKIMITQELLLSVSTGEYPPQPTIVKKLLPPFSDLVEYSSEGMVPLENRRFALKCFEEFKNILYEQV